MATIPEPMSELVAVVCVVESSLVLASEWPRVLVDYISPLLKRLGDAHTIGTRTFRMAFVTYGLSDTRPTPLLTKRFFVPLQTVHKEIREQASNLGIGQTSSGGGRGMAALEGLVAAVEMFDVLRESTEIKTSQTNQTHDTQRQSPRIASHILHVAASPADGSQKPLWNISPALDDVSWETLPAELKKRDINLSVINLRQNARFVELHSSTATRGVTPAWFKVRPPHTILLTGFPAELKPTTKRSTENHPSPDSKRAKVSQTPSELSPNIPNSSPASISSAEPAPNKLSQPPNRFNQTILQRFREVDAEWKKLKKNYDEAVAQNRVEAAQIKKERDNKQAELDQLKQAISTVIQSQPQHTRSNSQGQPQATNMAAPSTTQAPPQPPQVPSTKGDIPRGPDPQALIQLMHSRTAAHHNAPPGTPGFGVPPNITPEMASQMQKLVENRGIRPPQASFPQAQPAQQNPSLSMAVPAPTPLQPVPRAPTFFWEGSLSWTGFDVTTRDRKEMRAEVKVASAADIMSATWPSNLTLTPSREPAVSVQDLQIWAKRTKALVCTMQAHSRSVEQQTNERHFRSLVELLSAKRIYAQAAWQLPSGVMTTNILIFPFNGNGLIGTAFPATGIPELPKPTFPPNVTAQLQRLTSDQKTTFLTQLMRNRQQPQQAHPQPQPHQFQTHQSAQQPNYNLGAPDFGDSGRFDPANFQSPNGMDLLSNSTPGVNLTMNGSMIGSQPTGLGGHHRRTPSGNSMSQASNLSYEVLQSFIQRNADGSGGPMGPS